MFNDLMKSLKTASEEYPHYLVGEESEKSKDTVRSWIVDVYYDHGDVILQYSKKGLEDRDRAMSFEKLYESLAELSAPDSAPVELSLFSPGGTCRIDCPIVGAHLNAEKEVLVFEACDRSGEED